MSALLHTFSPDKYTLWQYNPGSALARIPPAPVASENLPRASTRPGVQARERPAGIEEPSSSFGLPVSVFLVPSTSSLGRFLSTYFIQPSLVSLLSHSPLARSLNLSSLSLSCRSRCQQHPSHPSPRAHHPPLVRTSCTRSPFSLDFCTISLSPPFPSESAFFIRPGERRNTHSPIK